ncbi:MAG: DUF1295 domain-containing protein [Clostridia bacterium]|nr:DUF1295 domain-containing protein [Clostridia bacterium]
MSIRKNRAFAFFIVAVAYVFAIAAGVAVYILLPFAFWLNLLLADIAATIVVFIFSVACKNASVYDPYWSVQPIVILVAFAVKYSLDGARIFPFIATMVWGIRLTANWAYTFKDLDWQDWRYTMLKEKTGVFYPVINFVGIHLVPTLVVYGCILPAVFTFVYGGEINVGGIVFFALSILAVLLQGTADVQMHKFRKKKTGGFIRDGLWKYSRHPNYLGEILMWWGIGAATVFVMPNRWWLLAGALANTLLFAFVSIPMAEKRQSRKEGFAEYKKQTHVLIPIKKWGKH